MRPRVTETARRPGIPARLPPVSWNLSTKAVALALLLAALFALPAAAEDAEKAVQRTLEDYEDAWSRHDAHAIASFYYEPAIRITAAGPVVRATRAEQEHAFNKFLPGLVRSGYDRSRWESLQIRLLDSNTAVASGVTVRYRSDGSLFARIGVTYDLYHTPDGWKIFLSASHAPESALQFRASTGQ